MYSSTSREQKVIGKKWLVQHHPSTEQSAKIFFQQKRKEPRMLTLDTNMDVILGLSITNVVGERV